MHPARLTALAACLLGVALLGGTDGSRAGYCSPNRAPQVDGRDVVATDCETVVRRF